MRKILAIIIGLIGVSVIGFAIYYFINRTSAPAPAVVGPIPESPQKQTPAESQLKLLSGESVFDYWIASSTQEIFYVSQEGKIAKANPDGQDVFLSEQVIENLNFVLPSPDGQKILTAFGSSLQPQFSIYDLIENSWLPLSLEIKSAAWSPEGKRLAAITNQNNQNNLVILEFAKNKKTGAAEWKTAKTLIKNFALKDLKMEWLRPDEIIFTSKPSYLTEGSAWRLNLAKLNFDEIIPPGAGLMIKWLKEDLGLKLQNQKSSLINWAGQTINDFLLVVLPNKCILKSGSLYCFLFETTSPKINWPDDYLQKSIYTRDNLYKFDLNNLTNPQLIFGDWGGKTIDASNLKLLDNQILFINRYDNQLYSLEIE